MLANYARNTYVAGVGNLGANPTRAADRLRFAYATADAVRYLAGFGFANPLNAAARNLLGARLAYPVAYAVANFAGAGFANPATHAAVNRSGARLAYPAGTAARNGFAYSLATITCAADFPGVASRNPDSTAASARRSLAANDLAATRNISAATSARITYP